MREKESSVLLGTVAVGARDIIVVSIKTGRLQNRLLGTKRYEEGGEERCRLEKHEVWRRC